jgi:surface polysaccharide O-acyltransferase-like enzyme
VDVFASFFSLLYSVIGRWVGEDKLQWAPSKRGTVSWFAMMSFFSLGRVFDGLRFLLGQLFLLGWRP